MGIEKKGDSKKDLGSLGCSHLSPGCKFSLAHLHIFSIISSFVKFSHNLDFTNAASLQPRDSTTLAIQVENSHQF